MAPAFHDIDGMNVVRVDDTGTAEASHDLREDVSGDFTPWEVAESSERDRDSGIDMSARYAARDPDTECSTCGHNLLTYAQIEEKIDTCRPPS